MALRTTIRVRLRVLIGLICLLLPPLFASTAFCDVQEQDETESLDVRDETPTVLAEPHHGVSLQSGYRWATSTGHPATASPYGRLKSGLTGAFSAASFTTDLKLTALGVFLNEDDYHSELSLDYGGLVRFHAESGALWHNLLREQVAPGTVALLETDAGREYGVRSANTRVNSRIRLGNNPFHLNLGYRELKREGYEQLIFSDYYRSGAGTIISEASRVDRVTREGSVGMDAHLGFFDLSYGFTLRDFSNEMPVSRYNFANPADGALIAGVQAHDIIPDSRVSSHTIKLFTDLSGGLVGTMAYTLTQRENEGGHGDALPSRRPTDMIHNAAGDMSYTPFKEFSLALKYRHQEIIRDSPAMIVSPFASAGTVEVRPSTDTVKDTVTISTTVRPSFKALYRLEYSAELDSRDNAWNTASSADPAAVHSDSRQTHTGKATFQWKPLNAIKLNATYSYAASDNMYYGTSFSGKHSGQFLVTYASKGTWGITSNFLTQYETGEGSASTVAPAAVATYPLPRKSHASSTSTSFWFSPIERLIVTASYAYLVADIDQSILFTTVITDPEPLLASNYHSSSHVYGIDAVYAVAEPLDVSVAFQRVHSKSRFDVPERTFNSGLYSTVGITDLTRLDSTETGISVRADWRIKPRFGCALDYGFRQYDSGNPVYDASVHMTMFSLKAQW